MNWIERRVWFPTDVEEINFAYNTENAGITDIPFLCYTRDHEYAHNG
jgi:hypothetical protein